MVKDTILLSADTSSVRFSLALLKGSRLIGSFESKSSNMCSSELLPETDKLLSNNSYSIKDIDAFCIGLGPGSFTGLRIGVTTVRGMALALKKPIIGIPSIDGLAYNLFGYTGNICPIIDAKQKKVYARIYDSNSKRIRPKGRFFLLGIKELLSRIKEPAMFLGDGIRLYKNDILQRLGSSAEFAPEPMWYPKAAVIGKLGQEKLRQGKRDNAFGLAPIYIYPKECQVKSRKSQV